MTPGALMAAEMAEQPERLAALIERAEELAERTRAVVPRPLAGTSLVARGSSDHAAVYGRYLIAPASRRPVGLASPSLLTLYDADIRYDGYLAIAISQSGRTPEIATTVRRVRALGGRAVAITNDPGSELASEADAVMDLGAGPERAVPATKTVTAEMVALAILARSLGDVPFSGGELADVPRWVAQVLADDEPPRALADRLAGHERIVVVARGPLYGAALEIALKIKETCGILADPYSAADLRHGPIAAVHPDVPVLAVSVPGRAHDDMTDLVDVLRRRDVTVHTVGISADVTLPEGAPEALAPIGAVVRGQQVARALSLALGLDPDEPAGLTKVTPT